MNRSIERASDIRYTIRQPAVWSGVLAFTLSFVVILVVATAYWLPASNRLSALHERVNYKRKQIVNSKQSAEIRLAYDKSVRMVNLLERKLKTTVKQAALVENLGVLAKRNNLEVLSETYEEGKDNGEFRSMYQEVSLSGTYRSVRKLLSDIRKLPTWTVLQAAKLERSREGGQLVKASLRLATFYRTKKFKE